MESYIFEGGRPPERIFGRVYSYPFICRTGAEIEPCALPFVSARGIKAFRCAPVFADVSCALPAERAYVLPFTGKNVTVAVIDTGISPHLDFMLMRNRIVAFRDFINGYETPYDDNGHGTAVCGIIAGNGAMSCGTVRAAAYKAGLAVIKAVDAKGEGNALNILEGMQWIFSNRKKYNIRVVNMSFGALPSGENDPLMLGAEALWKSGITVVASAGNLGPKGGTVLSPAASPDVIAVGGSKGDSVAEFSSRGPAANCNKPDMLAPAENVLSASSERYGCNSGTSMSAPQIAALAALVYEVTPDVVPDKVKEIIVNSCERVAGCGANVCGAGIISAELFRQNIFESFGV